MELSWTNDLSVGNRVIDSAHKEVLGMVNSIVRSIVAGDVANVSEAFKLLEKSLCAYFVVEENIARTLGIDFAQHRLAHQGLWIEFHRIKDELMAGNGEWSEFEGECCADSLGCCLIRHIKEDGKPLKAVLKTRFYDFNANYMCGEPVLHGCA